CRARRNPRRTDGHTRAADGADPDQRDSSRLGRVARRHEGPQARRHRPALRHRQRADFFRNRKGRPHRHRGGQSSRRGPGSETSAGGREMIGGNLSEWAINHRTLVVFFMLVCLGAGAMSYTKLGRQEDPPFSIKAMTVTAAWPGATTLDTMQQVTDRIARKLQETPHLHHINSFTKPGFSVLYVNLDDSADARLLPEIWYQVRKKVGDIRHTLPQGIQGPFFNDDFGDVYGILYGVTYDGFTPREARDFAEEARSTFLHASPDVSKIEIFGTQDEKIYLYFSPQKLAGLGIGINQVLGAIAD